MQHFSTLQAYCQGINISQPRWEEFDFRTFEENMKTVHHQMPPFKHEFYAIAIKTSGGGVAKIGNFHTADTKASVFFNSPYQILSWDIPPDWEGYYVIFSEDFYRNRIQVDGPSSAGKRITNLFPFLLIDQTLPIEISDEETQLFLKIFGDIQYEFELDTKTSKEIIAHYLHILLLKIRRLYDQQKTADKGALTQRDRDVELVSRFKSLLDTSFRPGQEYTISTPHQVQYYADILNVHPSHFNAIVKRITDAPASEHIQEHILSLAKSRLSLTTDSVKEIAYDLYYPYPNHFTSFFKKRAKMTPSQFRKSI